MLFRLMAEMNPIILPVSQSFQMRAESATNWSRCSTTSNISNVPTTREGIVDSCLLILFDWADGLLLEQEEIEKERGVIHEEWRLRTSAQQRMLERDLPKLYPGSKYGHRMPIGLMEIIGSHV